MIQRLLTGALLAALALAPGLAGPAAAQGNLFAPVARVNDRVVTAYELNQRILFYQALRAPGNPRELAMEKLIEERLQLEAAKAAGIEATEKDIETGLEEFAQRANLNAEQFLAALGQDGIAPETVRDFIRAGVVWRNLVRSKFGPQTQVTDAEVDRALAIAAQPQTGVRVLLSEIFLLANTPENAALAQQRAAEIGRITTLPAFAAAARQFSAANSREVGGRQDWIELSKLPPALRGQIMALSPGEVTPPIPVENAIALFQLRALEETGAPAQQALSVEFARYFIPGGRSQKALSEAARIRAQVDDCDDLYGIARGQSPDRLLRDNLPMEQIGGDVALELARLDEGEVSTALTTADGQALVFLMLCSRTLAATEEVDRDQVRQNLFNQRLASYADGYLSELKANAYIVTQ